MMMMMMKRVGDVFCTSSSSMRFSSSYLSTTMIYPTGGLWHLIRHWSLHALFQSRSRFFIYVNMKCFSCSMSALFHIQANDLWDAIVSRWIPPVLYVWMSQNCRQTSTHNSKVSKETLSWLWRVGKPWKWLFWNQNQCYTWLTYSTMSRGIFYLYVNTQKRTRLSQMAVFFFWYSCCDFFIFHISSGWWIFVFDFVLDLSHKKSSKKPRHCRRNRILCDAKIISSQFIHSFGVLLLFSFWIFFLYFELRVAIANDLYRLLIHDPIISLFFSLSRFALTRNS
jgi:hypothetical protein